MGVFSGSSKLKILQGGTKVKKAYWGATKIYSSGNIVTYVVDSGATYSEEVDEGVSVLSPASFTPTKSGWTFVGWREDTAASGEVLSSKVMGDEPITLYAVFGQSVTLTYYDNSTTTQYKYGTRYYNNSNINNPGFIMTQATSSGWTCRGWSTSNTGNASITYANGATITLTGNLTIYGLYQQTITLSYNGNGSTSGAVSSQSGTRYWAPAGYINPTFTLKSNGFAKTNYTFISWAMGSASGTQYAVGTSVTLAANTTMYAYWVQTVTNYAYSGGVQTFTAPVAGTYQLEVYGAQGTQPDSNDTTYGKGGYSKGNVSLSAGQIIYICIGGQSGYNGGGSPWGSGCCGGGATHITKTTNRGVLASYVSYQSEVLIVAGGGGGGGNYGSATCRGGHGGGTSGESGGNNTNGHQGWCGAGGTQTAAGGNIDNRWNCDDEDHSGLHSYTAYIGGSFGQGGTGDANDECDGGGSGGAGGGGGGWYGGAGSSVENGQCAAGGGGSGYIGGVSSGSMSTGVQTGNGKATVTLFNIA